MLNYLLCIRNWRYMKTELAIATALVIVTAASSSFMIVQSVMAKGTPFQAGYDHGCSDAKLRITDRYINQPSKGPSFHTGEFMNGYNAGFSTCSIHKPSSPILYKQGYAKGILDAKSHPRIFSTATMSPDDVDCDSDIDPKTSNADYCSGYQHGFADTNNNNANALPITSELPAAKSPPPVTSIERPAVAAPQVCPDGSSRDANGKCPPVTQAPTDQGTTLSTTPSKHPKDTDLSQLRGSLNSDNNPTPLLQTRENDNDNKLSKHHKGAEASTPQALTNQERH
jgi:hypothetical protein